MARLRARKGWVLGGVTALLLMGCGAKSETKASGQVLARVNDAEITVTQLNNVLAQQSGASRESKVARQQALDYLVDQEVLVQKAAELKLDQDPGVLANVEASRRQVLAAAAAQKVLQVTPLKPSDREITTFYNQHPEWFAQRKLFDFISFELPQAEVDDDLKKSLSGSKTPDDTRGLLTAGKTVFKEGRTQIAAEQVPRSALTALEKLHPGAVLSNRQGDQLVLMQLVQVEDAPVDIKVAHDPIASLLLKQRRAEATQSQMDALKKMVKISYLTKFADTPTPGAAPTGNNKAVLQSGLKGLKGL